MHIYCMNALIVFFLLCQDTIDVLRLFNYADFFKISWEELSLFTGSIQRR